MSDASEPCRQMSSTGMFHVQYAAALFVTELFWRVKCSKF